MNSVFAKSVKQFFAFYFLTLFTVLKEYSFNYINKRARFKRFIVYSCVNKILPLFRSETVPAAQ